MSTPTPGITNPPPPAEACDHLFRLHEAGYRTFFRPVKMTPVEEGLGLAVDGWNVLLIKRTPQGKISQKRTLAEIRFCPFCGAKLPVPEE